MLVLRIFIVYGVSRTPCYNTRSIHSTTHHRDHPRGNVITTVDLPGSRFTFHRYAGLASTDECDAPSWRDDMGVCLPNRIVTSIAGTEAIYGTARIWPRGMGGWGQVAGLSASSVPSKRWATKHCFAVAASLRAPNGAGFRIVDSTQSSFEHGHLNVEEPVADHFIRSAVQRASELHPLPIHLHNHLPVRIVLNQRPKDCGQGLRITSDPNPRSLR